MLVEIKIWDQKAVVSPTTVMLNPEDFYKCVRDPKGVFSYTLTTNKGDEYTILESEVDYLEKKGYIIRRK